MAKVNHKRVLMQGGAFEYTGDAEYHITVWNAKFAIKTELVFELKMKYQAIPDDIVDAEYEEFASACTAGGAEFYRYGRTSARFVFLGVNNYDDVFMLV
jgi:hypothetical protein